MSRRAMGLAISATIAVIGGVLVVAYAQGADDRAIAGEQRVEVLVVTDEVTEGTRADVLADRVELTRVPAKVRAAGAVRTLAALEGLVAATDLLPGEQVLRSRFVRPGATTSSAVDAVGLVKVSVALEPERMLGGALRAGDLVAVFSSTTDPDRTSIILHRVPVVSVQGNGDKEASSPTSKLMVTVALTEPAAESFVWAAEHGKIWLSLEPRTVASNASRP